MNKRRLNPALSPIATGLVIALTTIGCAHAADNPAEAKPTASGQSAHRVYLDPQTGKVIDHPPAAVEKSNGPAYRSAEQATVAGKGKSLYTPYVAEDGTRMVAISPEAAPAETMVRCADGSRRTAHLPRDAGPKEAAKLCQSAPHDH